jgi:hypothetical protein
MALTPYPTSLAPEDWAVALDAIKGKLDGSAHTAHCVYDALGFALGQVLPDGGLQAAPMASHPMKAEFAAVGAFNWQQLVAILLKILPFVLPFLDPAPVPNVP